MYLRQRYGIVDRACDSIDLGVPRLIPAVANILLTCGHWCDHWVEVNTHCRSTYPLNKIESFLEARRAVVSVASLQWKTYYIYNYLKGDAFMSLYLFWLWLWSLKTNNYFKNAYCYCMYCIFSPFLWQFHYL